MRRVRPLVVFLVVLAGILLVTDRVAAWAAQRTVADRVARELAAYDVRSAPPEVQFGGFPFLTQVAAGEYEHVVLRLRNVGSDQVRLPVVELTASGVTAPLATLVESGPIHAERMTGAATVGYDQVADLAGRPELSLSADNGRLAVRVPAEVLGTTVTLAGTADVELADGGVSVRVGELTADGGGGLPPGAEAVVGEIAADLSVHVPLPPLPYGLSLESVRAEPAGIVVTVSARDVPLSR
ncbi:MAG: DUF2993 domain-containing protein [Micromonosporaceae bacterium]|jgi:hypothetical protein